MSSDSFTTSGFGNACSPVILSVSHAGRRYSTRLLERLRVPLAATQPLEDRHADLLSDRASAVGWPTIIARLPRLVIDLNRSPDDLDPDLIRNGVARGMPVSQKARAGLGLVPSRLWGVGPLWRAPFEAEDIAQLIRAVHMPFHAAIAGELAAARRQWGSALLIDLHSMPPLSGNDAADIVIGDRFGCTAASKLSAVAEACFAGQGFRVALNAPYAGGYIVTRHARPFDDVHALQIEVDRRLYLDRDLDTPGPGLARMQAAILTLVQSLTQALTGGLAEAAE